MRLIIADCVAWCVCLTVGRLVCRNHEPCKNSWTDRDAICGVDSGGPKEPCVKQGSRSPHAKGQFWWGKSYLHGKWLAETARSTILQQQHPSFREMLDQVHFSCRRLCWKVTKYDDTTTPSSLAPAKYRMVYPFWCRLTQVVLKKRPLNGCST